MRVQFRPMSQRVRAWSRLACSALVGLVAPLIAAEAAAEVPVQRTFFRLASSNGHGAVMLDLSQSRVTHFREHLFASEEPRLDAAGVEMWEGNQPQVVKTRDLLYDAYFGLRAGGDQQWLTGVPVDLDASGYAGWQAGEVGGTGLATMVQKVGDLEATQFFFAPRGLEHAGMVMAMRLRNTGQRAQSGVSVFSLHNFHLGFGRPGPLAEIGEQGETIENAGGAGVDMVERAFAGVVVARALAPVAHAGASSTLTPAAENVFAIVDGGGTSDIPDLAGVAPTGDGSVSAYQFDVGALGAGEERWVGVVFAHHGDPFAAETVRGWLDGWAAGRSAEDVVADEIAGWAAFQGGLTMPPSATAEEARLLRHSAAVLRMAQVRSQQSYLREWLSTDGEPRYTRFGPTLDAPPATLPATVTHRGAGAVLASLPPGEWTYAWIRDGAYAAAGMSALGMKEEARAALAFYLGAEAGLFQDYNELASYGMPPYQISLTRYHGFGVEETDFNDFGPNLEFDGFGLFLWALRAYETLTGDETLAAEQWPAISAEIADVLLALIDPETGLIRKDSSIWETHWNGRQRSWAYTSITAARGLCDAGAIAERLGDVAKATAYRDAGIALRAAIAAKLTDASGALASNLEELASGAGHFDAAVLDGIAMGLFSPQGRIAHATLTALDANLLAPAGAGWSRNDDRTDHGGAEDLSPWGSEYDSAEWVVTDLRGAVAMRRTGDMARAERLLKWVRDQSAANYLAVAETYDEGTGTYKFNAPMAGFGAGAWALALFDREGALGDPACGAYFDEGGGGGSGGTGSGGPTSGVGAGLPNDDGASDGDGCGCRVASAPWSGTAPALAAACMALIARRRSRRGLAPKRA
jgi:GH15 family glucan-1,4-alpha-glucosidase